jgi:hypothetical protein
MWASAAFAQPTDRTVAAEALFAEARALVAKGDHAAACPKFEASLKLDPALGTRLNLADCYEALGRVTSAWAMFRSAADAARAANDNRAGFATNRAKALEPRLPKLVIKLKGDAPTGLIIKRAGEIVDASLIGTEIFVDPGTFTIVASAPGHEERTVEITATEGKPSEVLIEPLPEAPHQEPPPRVKPPDDIVKSPGRRRLGWIVGGAGLAAAGVGLGFGLAARSSWNSAFGDGLCSHQPLACTPAGQERADQARQRATYANILVGAGVGLVVAGAIVYLTAPEQRVPHVVPVASPDTVGLALIGGF